MENTQNADLYHVGYLSAKAYLEAILKLDAKFVEGFLKAMQEAIEARK